MTSIQDWGDVLNERMIDAWPRIAEALSDVDCALMGGTAVALHLRHRVSFDLDFVTLKPFDSRAVSARLLAAAKHAAYRTDVREHIATLAFDGVPVTVMRDLRGFVQGHVKDIQPGPTVEGIQIGSLPDLMAMKLDVIKDRQQLRDYLDICELDKTGACRLEDGLRYHRRRYAPSVSWEETVSLAERVTVPPKLEPDSTFDSSKTDVLEYLSSRRDAVRNWAIASAQRPRPAATSTPKPRSLPQPTTSQTDSETDNI